MNKISLLLLLVSSLCWAQNFKVDGLNIITKEGTTVVYFINGNSEGFYLDGKFMKSYGVLKLPSENFDSFIEDLDKASKKVSTTIERDLYIVEKFSFSEDEVFFNVKDKVGTITKQQIKQIKKL
jgi:hypothetical protein